MRSGAGKQSTDAPRGNLPWVLVVEDEALVRRSIAMTLESIGARSLEAGSLAEARRQIGQEDFELVLLDLSLPDGDGLELLAEIQMSEERPEVVILTGKADETNAEIAIKNGAWDYMLKPIGVNQIHMLNRILEHRKNRAKTAVRPIQSTEIIGSGPEMVRSLRALAAAANSDLSVLISGETGTGKELFARAVHANSRAKNGPFVAVDCATLAESLVESILFGSSRGAFTGADRDRDGLIRRADGGTLFLDEVGEMPLSIQKTFLRVLQEKRFRPVGSPTEIEVNFRLVSATNRDLNQMVTDGTFREDLLFRLRASHIEVPPLRSRRGEVRELMLHFMDILSRKYQVPAKGFTPEFLQMLTAYEWPGNVRELIGALEHAFSVNRTEPVLHPISLPMHIRVAVTKAGLASHTDRRREPGPEAGNTVRMPWKTYRESTFRAVERQYFKDLLESCSYDLQQVSKISGVGRTRLYEILKHCGLIPFRRTIHEDDGSEKRRT